ncbi:MAG: C39 family peptidase [Hyphomonas sp.]
MDEYFHRFLLMKRAAALNRIVIGLVFGLAITEATQADIFPSGQINGQPSVNSWKALRDFRIVKQQLDYSCGAASLTTILNEFYGMSVNEEEVLTRMGATDRSSFQQLAEVASSYGVRAGGIMLSFDDLKQLQVPAIAYVQYRGDDHFTVIRGIRRDGVVHVADPSWGNRHLTAHQFRRMWEAPDTDGKMRGRILLILPEDVNMAEIDRTFFAEPKGWSLTLQTIPLSR